MARAIVGDQLLPVEVVYGSNIAVVVNVDFPSDGMVVITVFGIS